MTVARGPRLGAAALILALMTALACGEGQGSEAAPAPERTVPWIEDGVIHLPPRFLEHAKLTFATAQRIDLDPVVWVTGVVQFDEQRVAAVGSRITGRIHELRVVPGAKVDVGTVLGTIESAELGTAQADLLAAEARLKKAKVYEDRHKKLREAGVSSQAGLDEAVESASVAEAELLAARQRVSALAGGPTPAGLGVAALRSPIAGVVTDVQVARGQAVEPTTTAFTVADTTQVWVQLAVFERELLFVHEGDEVGIARPGDVTAMVKGKVAHVSPVLDSITRSAAVRVVVDNTEGRFKIGQSVRASIATEGSGRAALTIPRKAVTTIDGQPTVFVAQADDRVLVRRVELGHESEDVVEIRKGLEAGERVVLEGAFAVKAEVFR
jgi:cobalt-zinc-cadmium efflux system membrane fusion protein